MSVAPWRSSDSPEKALTAIGTSCNQMVGGVVAVEPAARAVDDQGRVLDLLQERAHVLADQACPNGADRAGVVAGEFVARPLGHVALVGRDRVGEDALAGGRGEAFEILADGNASRLAGLGREAQIPFGVVADPRRHVDHHRAGEARGGRAGEDMPENGRAHRPADPDRALEPERLGERGDVGRELLDGRPGAVDARGAVAAQIDRDDPEIPGEIGLRAKEAAMRHQPVQKHERRSGALVAIADSRPVRSGKKVQLALPNAPLFAVLIGWANALN